MALARFVVTSRVTVTRDALATVTAGEPRTGAQAGYGSAATVSPGTSGKYGWLPATFLPSQVVWADSTAGSTGPQLLYQAIGRATCVRMFRARMTWARRAGQLTSSRARAVPGWLRSCFGLGDRPPGLAVQAQPVVAVAEVAPGDHVRPAAGGAGGHARVVR